MYRQAGSPRLALKVGGTGTDPVVNDTEDVDRITLRDVFAAFALAGQLAHQDAGVAEVPELVAGAYEFADAMLVARTPKDSTT